MKKLITDIATDALGRYEIKVLLGVPTFVAGIVYAMVTRDLAVAGFVSGNGLVLLGVTALADAKIDMTKGGKGA